jgi:F-type H+-transporting ATPase subunit alpha
VALDVLYFFEQYHSDIIQTLETTKTLTDELAASILEAADEFKNRW